MKLTDNNIDKNSARYWCLLSDKTLKNALKEVVKNANSNKLNEELTLAATGTAVVGTAASLVLWDILGRAYDNLTDTTKLQTYNEMIDGMKNDAYLDTETLKTELAKLGNGEFYKLVQASYIVRNYGQETEKNYLSKPVLGYERYSAEKQTTNSQLHANSTFYTTSPIEDMKSMHGFASGRDIKYDTETVKAAYEFLSKHNPIQIAAATAVDVTIDNSTMFLRSKTAFSPFGQKEEKSWQDSVDPLAVKNGVFVSGIVDYDRQTVQQVERALIDGKLKAEVKKGKIQIADNLEDLATNANKPGEKPAEEKSEEKPAEEKPAEEKSEEKPVEEKPGEKPAEEKKAVEQSVKDSPDIQQNSNAVAWIAGAVAAAVALPYLWKRLKQLTDYIKSGKTFAKCQFRCSENDQEYSFEYDLKQKEWKLKFAGSTALKYTPYPSDDEVNSFVKTKFAKEFVDEIEQQLKSLYSAKDKKLLFKAVQAAGKDGSDLIKYLFDNQKAIENSMYKINKYKLWESILKKYKMWESARLQERARH